MSALRGLWLRVVNTGIADGYRFYVAAYNNIHDPANIYLRIDEKKLRNVKMVSGGGVSFELKGHKQVRGGCKIATQYFIPVPVDEFIRAVQNPPAGLHEACDGRIVRREPPAPSV